MIINSNKTLVKCESCKFIQIIISNGIIFHQRIKLMHSNGLIMRWLEQEITNLTKNDKKSVIRNCFTETWEKTRIAINHISFFKETLYKFRYFIIIFMFSLTISSVVLILEIIYISNIQRFSTINI